MHLAVVLGGGAWLDAHFLWGQVQRLATDQTTMEAAGYGGGELHAAERTPRELYVEAFERGWSFEVRLGPAWTPRWRHGLLLALWVHTKQGGRELGGKLRVQ